MVVEGFEVVDGFLGPEFFGAIEEGGVTEEIHEIGRSGFGESDHADDEVEFAVDGIGTAHLGFE